MEDKYRELLKIPSDRLEAINDVLMDANTGVINMFMKVVEKYGTPEEINAKAAEARKLPNLLKKVEQTRPEYLKDLEWLAGQRAPSSPSPIIARRCWARKLKPPNLRITAPSPWR
jgi:hypothetical protein